MSEIVDQNSMLSLSMQVEWQSDGVKHTDVMVFERFNVWRDSDLLPEGLQQEVLGKMAGHVASRDYAVGDVIPAWSESQVFTVKLTDFHPDSGKGLDIKPARGRFYPQGWISNVPDIYQGNMRPGRLISISEKDLTIDNNHPMAAFDMKLGVEILNIGKAPGERGGRCNEHVLELLDGPGMQAQYKNEVTDFFAGNAFDRLDTSSDELFYSVPRMVNHLDETACREIEKLYSKLIPENSCVLDLMASCHSHLSAQLETKSVSGLGMNEEELKANTRLDNFIVHDLNVDTVLPYEDSSMDVVICTASVEYLVKPVEVFKEVERVLKPGGIFINTFSNRWFPTKSVAAWSEMHEFERLGFVIDLYRYSNYCDNLHTWSLRGLPRPEDDTYADRLYLSDPVYAVWASKETG